MITIPKHIWDYLDVLIRRIESTDAERTSEILESAKKLKEEMLTQSGDLFLGGDNKAFVQMIEIAKAMFKIRDEANEYLRANFSKADFAEVTIEPELITELNFALADVPKLRDEVRIVVGLLEKSHYGSWSYWDAECQFKRIKVLTASSEWKEIRKKDGDALEIPGLKNIKVYYIAKRIGDSRYPEGTAKKVKNELMQHYGYKSEAAFDVIREAFELWFHFGCKGVYYVYIPRACKIA